MKTPRAQAIARKRQAAALTLLALSAVTTAAWLASGWCTIFGAAGDTNLWLTHGVVKTHRREPFAPGDLQHGALEPRPFNLGKLLDPRVDPKSWPCFDGVDSGSPLITATPTPSRFRFASGPSPLSRSRPPHSSIAQAPTRGGER